MPIDVITGTHTPSGTSVEQVHDLSAEGPGVYYCTVDLTAMQGGDTVVVSGSAQAGDGESREVQRQSFSGDQGLTAAEVVVAVGSGSFFAGLNIQQSAGVARTFDYAIHRIYEA